MKFRAAMRVKREHARVMEELAGLNREAEDAKAKIAASDAEIAKLDQRLSDMVSAVQQFRALIARAHENADIEVVKVRAQEAAEVASHETNIYGLNDRERDLSNLRAITVGQRAADEGVLTGIDPRRDTLLRELKKWSDMLSDADAKIGVVLAAQTPCDRCKGQKYVPGGINVIPCPECQAPKVVKIAVEEPKPGLTVAKARARLNLGGSRSRHGRPVPIPPIVRRVSVTQQMAAAAQPEPATVAPENPAQ